MINPLFERFGNNQQTNQNYGAAPNSQSNNPISNMTNMMKSFNQFKNTFTGDPKQTVMNLLSSGQMSQTQFGQLQEMAKQFSKLIGH